MHTNHGGNKFIYNFMNAHTSMGHGVLYYYMHTRGSKQKGGRVGGSMKENLLLYKRTW